MNNILILGGDGYLGWPTAMYLSMKNCKVTVVDNYLRRNLCNKLDIYPLYNIPNLIHRATLWHQLTGLEIKVVIGDLQNPELMRSLFNGTVKYDWAITNQFSGIPSTVVHYAEMPSAPYSMIDYKTANFTISNNLITTNNLMWAVKDFSPDTHIVKLGTMGEYGTPNIDIEEGWLEIEHKGRKDKFLYPRQAGSLYHTTKIMDTDLLWFGVRMWNLKVTDLMQGPVYGLEIEDIKLKLDENLYTIFNYDEIFGTVINRFIVQAIVGYPLTVYGAGGQTRGYININDTLQCIYLSIKNPPQNGDLKIYNQFTETFTVNELAERIKSMADKLGYDCKINSIKNPRKEQENHYYNVNHKGLLDIGLKPHYLTDEVLERMFKVVEKFKDNIKKDIIFKGIKW
ncbi:MAG: NAD-dependent epimerase/dehydratase family protein [Candidatus Acidulodesulfobacterium acidiphilum]|uniref:NAD-dependent epimerase/dehydratase family protein n=1 Tax=Candidatus Acidulodesulfobacterium acidiphilum TaxID=2597224 RepID=A0A520XBZ0_9DELT|nr:MAG: NAD-dependent epimerase/dehydratase family protein [Candidatus Acidulodesulfobacterium acidiphilum]